MQISDAPSLLHTDHAHLAQTLSAMMVQINALQALLRAESAAPVSLPEARQEDSLPPTGTLLPALRDGLATLEQMTREVLHDIRSLDEAEPLAELIGVTLPEALSRAIEETAESSGFSSRITFSGEERTLPSYTEGLLYRIAQEALYQVQQHTGTRKLRLTFTYGHKDVQMSIEYDGVAAPPGEDATVPPFTSSSPLTTDAILSDLRQRTEHLGGSLEISAPTEEEQLSHIRVRIPYNHHPETTNRAGGGANANDVVAPLAGARGGEGARDEQDRVRVLVVEAQAVTRAGLRRLLESYPGLQVVGEAADGVQAVSETMELGPQVVLMDMQLPNGQSLEALRQIKQLNLNTHVLLLSALDREEYLYETLRAGAGGYVLKDIAPDELAQAVRTVARGEVLVQPQLARHLLTRIGRQARGNYPYETLTAREQEVLRLLARGLRNKEMAARLHVSERTITFHLANIYQKLNVSGRTEALSKALEHGLITA